MNGNNGINGNNNLGIVLVGLLIFILLLIMIGGVVSVSRRCNNKRYICSESGCSKVHAKNIYSNQNSCEMNCNK